MAWHDEFHPDKVYRYNDAKEWVRNAPDEETAAGRPRWTEQAHKRISG